MKKRHFLSVTAILLAIGLSLTGCDLIGSFFTKPSALTGTVTINNTSPKVGDTLSASYTGGNGTGAASWQWLRGDEPISGATSDTYTVVAEDENKTLKVRVSYPDQTGSVTSVATVAVAANAGFSTDLDFQAIAYGNERFVAGGYSGRIAYSGDGVNWTPVDSTFGTEGYILGIAYSPELGRFVAVGSTAITGGVSRVAYSDDGERWTMVGNTTFGKTYINSIAYGGGRFIAVGSDAKTAYSYDGVTWTQVIASPFYISESYSLSIYSIAYGGGSFVIGGSVGLLAYSSNNGLTWVKVVEPEGGLSISNSILIAMGYGKNLFITGAYISGNIAYSEDNGVTWKSAVINNDLDIYSINDIAIGGSSGQEVFVAVGMEKDNDPRMIFSSDGKSWTAVTPFSFSEADAINAVAYGGERFVAGSRYGNNYYSINGMDWILAAH